MKFDVRRDPSSDTKVGLHADHETHCRIDHDQPPPWKEGDRLHGFILERLLGSGSSGFVYRAIEVAGDQKRQALKLLRPSAPEKLLLNKLGFRKMMTVDHPNLVRVHRIHQLGSYVALSMDEVEGETFGRARRKLLELDPEQAYQQLLNYLRQFASGLAAMHHRGLIHRDMKPANIMVGTDGVAKIIDYGLVTRFQMDKFDCKPRGLFLGTPRYIAPEVYWSQQYLPSGDIFCMGIVFLETLLSIQNNANKRVSELTRSKQDRNEDQERISEAIEVLQESVPSMILETCRQMLSSDPGDRPTAAELSRVGFSDSASAFVPRSPTLFGREYELNQVTAWVDRVFAGFVGRLHISGPSGIGKSRLVDEVTEYIESKKWGQVFYAKCRIREDQPMQAFDQICDAIADRYMQSDREPIELDPVSTTILKNRFPVLESVLVSRMDLAPPGRTTEAMDALEAAVRMSHQLRLVGPMFIVIDDSQWEDVDSSMLLDRLSIAAASVGLGIITVSRELDVHRQPAQHSLEIGPLSHQASVSILRSSAQRWDLESSESVLRRLAAVAEGSPYRLQELANELRSTNGMFDGDDSIDPAISGHDVIDQLWQRRVSRLSDDAQHLLPFVATAGGRMSLDQLGKLSGLNDTVDASVTELVLHGLVSDDATGGDCIQVAHDRVADEMIRSLSDQAKRKAHLEWAKHLAREKSQHGSDARIAGHFFAAGEPRYALSHAILAAEEAEQRLASHEAGRLYRRVAKHVDGSERIAHLRKAADCFRDAEYPVESAECFQELAGLLNQYDRFDCELTAIALLIRAGRIAQVRSQLHDLAIRMRIPKPKSYGLATWAVIARQMLAAIDGPGTLLAKLQAETNLTADDAVQLDRSTQQRLDLCYALVRPLFMFDNLYAAELSIFARRMLLRHRNTKMRIHGAVMDAVFGCYDQGKRRVESEGQLTKLKAIVSPLNDARSSGDVAAAISVSHAFAGRWYQVTQTVQEGIEYYGRSPDIVGFEILRTQMLGLWALWHVGQWGELRALTAALYKDGVRRSDGTQQFIASNGYCASAWLIADEVNTLKQIEASNLNAIPRWEQFQFADVYHWAGQTQRRIYQARYDEAWDEYQRIRPKLKKMPFSSIQMVRLVQKQLCGILSLQQLRCQYSELLLVRAKLAIRELRKEQTPYANMLADLYGGLLLQQIATVSESPDVSARAIGLLKSARDEAKSQQLLPFQLAATDALNFVETGQQTELLADSMRDQGVVNPRCYRRLFTVDFGS